MKRICIGYALAVLLFCLHLESLAVGPGSLPPWPGSGTSSITCNCQQAFPCSSFEQRLCAYACNAPGGDDD